MTKAEFVAKCKELGADLVGVASLNRFAGEPDAGRPEYLLPSAKSVVVLGHAIPRGWFRGTESQSQWETAYRRGGCIESPITIEIVYNICVYLEENGYDGVPMYQYPLEMRGQGVRVKPENPEPDVVPDTYHAAWAAGLGQVGRLGLFLTPEFGVRQQFTVLVTNAELEPDPIVELDFCRDCRACVQGCPVGAIGEENFVVDRQCDSGKSLPNVREEFCRQCQFGARPNPFMANAEPDRMLAACSRACIAHLEDNNGLHYQFKNPFRD